jgi:hypothetical protein
MPSYAGAMDIDEALTALNDLCVRDEHHAGYFEVRSPNARSRVDSVYGIESVRREDGYIFLDVADLEQVIAVAESELVGAEWIDPTIVGERRLRLHAQGLRIDIGISPVISRGVDT